MDGLFGGCSELRCRDGTLGGCCSGGDRTLEDVALAGSSDGLCFFEDGFEFSDDVVDFCSTAFISSLDASLSSRWMMGRIPAFSSRL